MVFWKVLGAGAKRAEEVVEDGLGSGVAEVLDLLEDADPGEVECVAEESFDLLAEGVKLGGTSLARVVAWRRGCLKRLANGVSVKAGLAR